ncbi:hypothetical protein ABGN05_01060 [Aquibium sp. LZ166]|uniref:Uncharacterized protein n=1 Tax=Aquibium pacificus TaxID=3153579 RepID=A0ABV3SC53_9HYPH
MKPPLVWLALIVLGIWPISVHGDDLAGSGADIQKIIAALEATDLSANEIRAIDSFVRLDVVDLSAFESSDDYQALETALRGTEDGWAMVQTAIVSNDAIEQELTRRSVAIRRVVAATRDPTNAIAIYIR